MSAIPKQKTIEIVDLHGNRTQEVVLDTGDQ